MTRPKIHEERPKIEAEVVPIKKQSPFIDVSDLPYDRVFLLLANTDMPVGRDLLTLHEVQKMLRESPILVQKRIVANWLDRTGTKRERSGFTRQLIDQLRAQLAAEAAKKHV